MTTYVDTSVLVAFYLPERFSRAARREVSELRQLPFTSLHELEFRTALELMVGRGQLTLDERDAVATQVDEDRQALRLAQAAPEWDQALALAVSLSREHSARTLARSLDVLHVATAATLGCERFVTADRRQAALAAAAGLSAVNITAARSSHPTGREAD